jgi:type I restriction enzyme S subunit
MKTNWQTKKLGEVCKTSAGGTPLKSHKEYYEGGNIPWLMSGEVSQGDIYESIHFITENGLKNSSAKLFPENSVLIAMYGATAGQVGILKFSATTNQAVCGILPNQNYLPKFLFYFFLSKKDELVSQATGNAQPNISQEKIKNTQVPVLNILEQRRIVAVLDEVFLATSMAKENAEKNLKNSRALFESYLQDIFANPKGDWEEKSLGEVCDTGAGGTPLKSHKDYYEDGNIPWLRSGEVCQKDILESELFITEKGLKNSSARMFPKNTVLVAMYGATAGQTGILRFESSTNQAVCGILPNKNFIPEYLYYYFTAKKQDLVKQAVGGAQPNISQIKIKNTLIPILDLPEQKAIVARLDALSGETKKLEEIYCQKIADVEELKKSVLKSAFAGKY